jgi:glucose-6-phosphate 1-epimerase
MPNNTSNWTLEHQPFGAQLLQASFTEDRPGASAIPVFYLSPQSAGVGSPVRGGVPVLFPQFNDEGPLPKHGFVRTANWRALDQAGHYILRVGSSHAHQSVDSNADSTPPDLPPCDLAPPDWPHSAELVLEIHTSGPALELMLNIINTGTDAFSWTGGLHPYFSVSDLLQSRLEGLGGVPTRDRFHPDVSRQPEGDIHWDGQLYERLFDTASPVELQAGAARFRLSMSGFNQWMVWNPGIAGAQAMKDLPDADWQRFVCVEPVIVQRAVCLEPGEGFTGSFRIEVIG